ncbi:MAG: NAD-dependent protein deacetylase [Pseudomonadales bacterium]|nr:NAD-dependent protein deacetylase [Pseudomonadales bacterium]MDG1441362.1 NAD-dependent protein deacetylase [Pseudomonadales bacterium]
MTLSTDSHILADFILANPNLLIISGAGCSQDSGIPTYRDKEGNWLRNDPIQHKDYLNDAFTRQRYWARSYYGWRQIVEAQPNSAHQSLVTLQKLGFGSKLVTQNVDGLHQLAGHKNVIDLHGSLSEVVCLSCGEITDRNEHQKHLLDMNPSLDSLRSHPEIRPDGDAEVDNSIASTLNLPKCGRCKGVLKPNVVFYGGSVDRGLVQDIYQMTQDADAVLIIGSSLMVFSSFRFVKRARELEKPIVAINDGMTRADDFLTTKFEQPCQELLIATTSLLTQQL